jgi:hypothetical protein
MPTTSISCHDCGAQIPDGLELWRAPEDGHPDEDSGEPYCPECAAPLGIAA